MAKAKAGQAVQAATILELPKINSMRDIGYQQAKLGDTLRLIAIEAIEREAGLPDTMSDDGKVEYYAGVDQRHNDINPIKTYFVLDGKYVEADVFDANADVSKLESVQVGTAFVMSMTGQAFGSLNNSKSKEYNPELYKVVKVWRDKVKKYRKNKYDDLITKVKQVIKERSGTEQTRAARDEFTEWLKGWFSTGIKRCKVSVSQYQDTTADIERFKRSEAAFYAEYNKE
jgi:hypothetical protein